MGSEVRSLHAVLYKRIRLKRIDLMKRNIFYVLFIAGLLFSGAAIFTSTSSLQSRTEVALSPDASTTLVISQAYGGGGGTGFYSFDYVEIKNISSTNQSLNGLSLVYGSA